MVKNYQCLGNRDKINDLLKPFTPKTVDNKEEEKGKCLHFIDDKHCTKPDCNCEDNPF